MKRFSLFLAAFIASQVSADVRTDSFGAANSAEARGLKKNDGPTIILQGIGSGGYNYPTNPYGYPAYHGVSPTFQLTHNRVPSTRVASLDTRSSPIAVVERPVLIAPASRPVCTAQECGPSLDAQPAVVVEREAVTQIVREKTCPQGMDLSRDGMCVGLDICPVTYTCPPNTNSYPDGRCVMTQRAQVECPYGQSLRGHQCVSTEVAPAELTCRDPSYSLDYSANVCVMTIESPPQCPGGFRFESNGECIQRVPTQSSCPPGYTISPATKECVRTFTEPAQPVCPEGAYQKPGTDVCVVTRQDPPRCPPRFTFDSHQGVCVQQIPKVPTECPYGFNRLGPHCEKTERSPANFTCPPGYDLGYDNVCVQSVEMPPSCPPGYLESSSFPGRCEKCVKEQPQCPPETRQSGFGSTVRCTADVELPSKECCAPGFTLENGRCRRIEMLAPTLACQNECYTVTEVPVAYACPSDMQFVDHPSQPRCVRTIAVNRCESPPPSAVRCLEELSEEPRSLKGNVCTPVPHSTPVCAPIESNESLPAEAYCPNGGSVEGRRCVVREPIVPERVCRVGVLDPMSGQCIRETINPVKTECPAGSVRKGTKCIATETVTPEFVCPQGSEMGPHGVCVSFREMLHQPPKISRVPAVPRCDAGNLSGRECLQSSRHPIDMVCPPGAVDNGRDCYATAELITPPPVEKTVRPSLVCAPGSNINGRVCVTSERVPAEECCPPGTVQQVDGCHRVAAPIVSAPRVQTQPAVPICSDGGVVRGTSCVRTMESQPFVSCAEEFQLEGDRCVRALEKSAICPSGTQLQGSGCVRPVTVAPTIRIIKGCINEILRDCETCPPQVRAECHNQY